MKKDQEIWRRLTLEQIDSLLGNSSRPWWIAGGLAIDLFLGRETRTHEDLDIVIDRNDLGYFQSRLNNWDLRATDPPGSLRPLLDKEIPDSSINAIWCRENFELPWQFEFLLSEFSDNEWIYRRNPNIRGPRKSFGWRTENGINVVNPEIQLLYKAKARRPKDDVDFNNCLSFLGEQKSSWLRKAIEMDFGLNHAWISKF